MMYIQCGYAELTHHSCGFLFGVLHDDGNLLSDYINKLVSDARLCVQDGATNVDAVKKAIVHLLHSQLDPQHHIFK